MKRFAVVLWLAGAGGPAAGQTPYALEPGSVILREFCLPPCLCPSREFRGPVAGGFTLELIDTIPWFRRYRLSDIRWHADAGQAATWITGSGLYTIGGDFALVHRLQLWATSDAPAIPWEYDSGFVPVHPQHPFPGLGIATSAEITCRRDTLTLAAAPGTPGLCYANCDTSSSPPILNVVDFVCFLQRYAAGDAYANCDGSTVAPVLNVQDFTCFLATYAAGCP